MKSLLLGIFAFFQLLQSSSGEAATERYNYFVSDECSIYDREGNILKKFNGDLCIFFDDGSFLRNTEDTDIQLYNQFSQSMWKLNGFFHHMSALNIDKNLLLLIGSEGHNKMRIDTLVIADRNGKIKKEVSFKKFINQLTFKMGIVDWNIETLSKYKKEYTHVNSFYEIPANMSNLSYLKQGHYIVNDRASNQIIIFDNNLEKIAYTFNYSAFSKSVHDAQILKNGNLLIFNNRSVTNNVENHYSTIDEIDLAQKKLVWRYQYKKPENFQSKVCGTVQVLPNGNYFFTAVLKEEGVFALELSKEKVEIKRTKLGQDPKNCHRLRLYPLELFFKNNQSI